MKHERTPIRRLNMMNAHGFVRTVTHAFDNASWVAERCFHLHPFASIDDLHEKMCRTVQAASEEEKVQLIRAHGDLFDPSAEPISDHTRAERTAAGIDSLSADERESFQAYNDVYREQFDFPFVISIRENDKAAILAAYPRRLRHSRAREIDVNIEELCKTARLRLQDAIVME